MKKRKRNGSTAGPTDADGGEVDGEPEAAPDAPVEVERATEDTVPIGETPTQPYLRAPVFEPVGDSPEEPTDVSGAPADAPLARGQGAGGDDPEAEVEEGWDGPTRVGDVDELAALAAQSDPAAPEAPAVDSASRLESILESLLFASDRPLGLADLKRLVSERDGKKVTAALEALQARHQETGIQLVSAAGGWQLRTHVANAPWVAKLIAGRPARLSRAMLETLAIVAYRQPITRPEMDEIRGVDCGPVLRTLLDRGLVRMIGKKEEVGRPILYGTTPEFLRTFSLKDLTELPTLREFHELGAAEMAKVQAVSDAAAAAAAAAAGAEVGSVPRSMPAPSPLPDHDPEEEDALLSDLDAATAAATRAATAPEPAAPASPEAPAPGPEASE